MVQAAQQYDSDPPRRPSLSPDEQRIADAVIAALKSELLPVIKTQEQLVETQQQLVETQQQHTLILENIQLEMRGVNRILASAGLIPDNPDI